MNPILCLLASLLASSCLVLAAPRPNIILAMADDMGWGDPGYNSMTVTYADGTPHPDQGWINTPSLDTMAANGLRCGHFGKWHLGTLTTLRTDANRASNGNTSEYSAPWHHRYDFCFATDGTVATFSHPQNANPPSDLVVFYEWSSDLATWHVGDGLDGSPGGPFVTFEVETAGTTRTVNATSSAPIGRCFLRAKAELTSSL